MSFARFIFIVLFFISCGIHKQRIIINDFFIHPNGFVIAEKPIHAFIFENRLANEAFQSFIAENFQTKNLSNKTVPVKINGSNFVLVFYDNDEFEKYFGTQNFEINYQETNAEKTGNMNKFIPISVLTEAGEDCLNANSLLHNVATEYLVSLKKQYFLQNGRI